jgi:hypothetical protein
MKPLFFILNLFVNHFTIKKIILLKINNKKVNKTIDSKKNET